VNTKNLMKMNDANDSNWDSRLCGDRVATNIKGIRWRKKSIFRVFDSSMQLHFNHASTSAFEANFKPLFGAISGLFSTTSTWPVRWIDGQMNRRLDWFRCSFIQSWEGVSRGKITTGTFERVKIGADPYPFEDGAHHVTPRLASCILQFVRLDRWGSLTRFLH
jgi:hypothetical protein